MAPWAKSRGGWQTPLEPQSASVRQGWPTGICERLGAEQAPASEGHAPDELPPELLPLVTPPLELPPPTVVLTLELLPLLELPFPDPPDPPDPDDELDPMMMVHVEPPDELPDELPDDSEPRLWPPVNPHVDPPLPPLELPPSQSSASVQALASMSHTCPLGQSQSQLQNNDEPSSKHTEPAQPEAEPPASTP